MSIVDLLALASCVDFEDTNGQHPFSPNHGEGAAFKRLAKAGLMARVPDMPGHYYVTEDGRRATTSLVHHLRALSEKRRVVEERSR